MQRRQRRVTRPKIASACSKNCSNERYSVRAFLPQPVPRETIEHVLTVAQRTASWCNSQPWQVLIASGEAKERFRKAIYAEAASGAERRP